MGIQSATSFSSRGFMGTNDKNGSENPGSSVNPIDRLTDEILHTVFCEIECIVNSRPITKCSDDIQDVASLTPNHLLLLRDNQAAPWGVFYDGDTYRKHWRHVQHLATLFWRRWVKEYLPELQRRKNWVKYEPNLRFSSSHR